MENVNFPSFLVLPDSLIKIYYEDRQLLNSTKSAIVIEGTSNSFLSLSNLINVYNNYLTNPIVLTEFPFVTSELVFQINVDSPNPIETGYVIKESESEFTWMLSENAIFTICSLIHSLGYANPELHLDSYLNEEQISVYCSVL